VPTVSAVAADAKDPVPQCEEDTHSSSSTAPGAGVSPNLDNASGRTIYAASEATLLAATPSEDRATLPATPTSEDHAMRRARRMYPITHYRDAWSCPGSCRRIFPLYHRMYICRICLTELCCDCWTALVHGTGASGGGGGSRCAPDHDWLQLENPNWETQTEMVLWRRRMDLDEFKDRLWAEWR
jgi:hypothetical protein